MQVPGLAEKLVAGRQVALRRPGSAGGGCGSHQAISLTEFIMTDERVERRF